MAVSGDSGRLAVGAGSANKVELEKLATGCCRTKNTVLDESYLDNFWGTAGSFVGSVLEGLGRSFHQHWLLFGDFGAFSWHFEVVEL